MTSSEPPLPPDLLDPLLLPSLRSGLFFPDRTHNTARLQLQQQDTVGKMVWEASEGRCWISRAFVVLVRGIGMLCNGGGADQGLVVLSLGDEPSQPSYGRRWSVTPVTSRWDRRRGWQPYLFAIFQLSPIFY
jgi:hypothetical protein